MIVTINQLKEMCQNSCRLLGIDWGEERIGLAISDKGGLIASPLRTIARTKSQKKYRHLAFAADKRALVQNTALFWEEETQKPWRVGSESRKALEIKKDNSDPFFSLAISEIIETIEAEGVVGLVIGLPLNMDGSRGFQAERVMSFARALSDKTSVPILFADERLSSQAVERALQTDSPTSHNHKKDREQDTKRQLDHVAAAFVLQGVLDAIANHN
ncbi:MAG: Holliday junction resolvase RuvX [Holosporales bacterium]|nr:Holliday junction resolvase RuvX [Holosporales bacterium]